MAHYTNDPQLGHNCHVDDCIAEEQCNRSLGIPTDVAPYEAIIHTDIQTPIQTPTQFLSYSESVFLSI